MTHDDKFDLDVIDHLVETAQSLKPRTRRDGAVRPTAVVSDQGMLIALLDANGVATWLLHPDTFCEMLEISRERFNEMIESGEIPSRLEE